MRSAQYYNEPKIGMMVSILCFPGGLDFSDLGLKETQF